MKKSCIQAAKGFACSGLLFALVSIFYVGCDHQPPKKRDLLPGAVAAEDTAAALYYSIDHQVPIRTYVEFMDSLLAHLDTTVTYPLNEHLIVRANPWLIDTLAHTDYYYLMDCGIIEQ